MIIYLSEDKKVVFVFRPPSTWDGDIHAKLKSVNNGLNFGWKRLIT